VSYAAIVVINEEKAADYSADIPSDMLYFVHVLRFKAIDVL
jgi:hypothetical protein